MKLIIGFIWGAFVEAFWYFSIKVGMEPYFVLPAFFASLGFIIYVGCVVVENWDKK